MLKPLPGVIRERLDETYGPAGPGNAHPNDITLCGVRILWATEVIDNTGPEPVVKFPAGWVFPGGRRTSDRALASMTALRLAALSTH